MALHEARPNSAPCTRADEPQPRTSFSERHEQQILSATNQHQKRRKRSTKRASRVQSAEGRWVFSFVNENVYNFCLREVSQRTINSRQSNSRTTLSFQNILLTSYFSVQTISLRRFTLKQQCLPPISSPSVQTPPNTQTAQSQLAPLPRPSPPPPQNPKSKKTNNTQLLLVLPPLPPRKRPPPLSLHHFPSHLSPNLGHNPTIRHLHPRPPGLHNPRNPRLSRAHPVLFQPLAPNRIPPANRLPNYRANIHGRRYLSMPPEHRLCFRKRKLKDQAGDVHKGVYSV